MSDLVDEIKEDLLEEMFNSIKGQFTSVMHDLFFRYRNTGLLSLEDSVKNVCEMHIDDL